MADSAFSFKVSFLMTHTDLLDRHMAPGHRRCLISSTTRIESYTRRIRHTIIICWPYHWCYHVGYSRRRYWSQTLLQRKFVRSRLLISTARVELTLVVDYAILSWRFRDCLWGSSQLCRLCSFDRLHWLRYRRKVRGSIKIKINQIDADKSNLDSLPVDGLLLNHRFAMLRCTNILVI